MGLVSRSEMEQKEVSLENPEPLEVDVEDVGRDVLPLQE